ncbi:P63C domain-containing protein [Methylobacterium sp. B4]|uniref:P63C domain-containing protein n=1 Tax=Methylobacterium sp. B4 TaxID=1938755 RepID=UPI000D752CDE|nr:P63C domain-containing protein [Methylobacterium sp. B4]PXW53108.1 P63C domain-containing protein [Methylobacterium sp. B4]
MARKATPQSQGGIARSQKLTPEERSRSAREAAKARWAKIADPNRLPIATHEAPLKIGAVTVDAYRLDDGRRMISKAAMAAALGLKSTGGSAFLRSMTRPAIRSRISDDLWHVIDNPHHFRPVPNDLTPQGLVIDGYEGEVLIDACSVLIDAGRAGTLNKSQEFLAKNAEIIQRSAAKLGIIGLIDEAVGFTDRAKDEYRELFQQFVVNEWSKWEKEFPDQFPDMLYRLYGMKRFDSTSSKHPRFFAKFTRKFIYHPLANSKGKILEMLDEKNPVVYANGGRKYKLFQFLSEEVGMPAIRAHLWQVVGIGNSSKNIKQFERGFFRAFPEATPIGHQWGLLDDIDDDT